MYVVVWEYQIKPGKRSEFEKAYSSNGAWAELFKRGSGYLGTELLRSEVRLDTYITIDRWDSKESYESFLSKWKQDYERLDEQCEGLTESEKRIGRFTKVTL